MTTLVIGARGSVGRHVLDQLLNFGEPVRASVRNLATADLPSAVTVVEADLTKPDTLAAALAGVGRVFLYSTPDGTKNFIDAAHDAGVEHVVVMSSGSVLLPYATGNVIAEEHRTVEQEFAASGLRWTPIRPLVLANNALNWATSIRTGGAVKLVYPEALMAPIHEQDIAAVAVAALTGRTDDTASSLLTGGELVTQRQQVEAIGRAIGKVIHVDELTEDQARRHFGSFGQPDIADAIIEFIVAASHGGSPATDTAQHVLGRSPIPFAQWARDHVTDFHD